MSAIRTTALLLDERLSLSLGERALLRPVPGEVLVRLEWAGVCGSDLHVLRTGDWVSEWPATLGHEAVGVVTECPGDEFAIGCRVIVDSRMPCGHCPGCTRGRNLCERLRWVGEGMPGAFQRHAVFPAEQLVGCPPTLESAVAVLAEPLAVAMHAVNRAGPIPERVLIMGYGPVGALVHAEIMRRRPESAVTVVEPFGERQLMAQAAGAVVLPALDSDTWPLIFDAAGYANALTDAIRAAESGGTVVLVALAHVPAAVRPQEITERALSIIGSIGFESELPQAVEALDANPSAYRWLITESVLLDEAASRLAQMSERPSSGKVVIAL